MTSTSDIGGVSGAMEAQHGGQATASADDAVPGTDAPAANPPGLDATGADDAGAAPLWLNVPARPGQLAGLRRALREWMALAGIRDAEAAAVQQAVGEATTNAVEHAYADTDAGLVLVTAQVEAGGTLVVEVSDSGRWREPRNGGTRGRGLPLMRACMDYVQVTRAEGGGTTVVMRRELDHRPA